MPIKISEPSVKSLYIEMYFDYIRLSSATAFICYNPAGKPYLITNRHNFTGRDQNTGKPISAETAATPNRVRITHSAGEFATFIDKYEPLYDDAGVPLWIEHPSLKETADFVALRLTDITGIAIHDYQRGPGLSLPPILPSYPVSIIGFPFGIRNGNSFAVWSTGFVASEPDIDHGGLPVFLVDCRTRQGQSGSPVIQHMALATLHIGVVREYEQVGGFTTLLGVYSGRVRSDSDLGIVWKATAIWELLDATTSI